MINFKDALKKFELDKNGSYKFKFGRDYELWFEKLLFDDQYYLALYRNKELLFSEKVPVKPGKEEIKLETNNKFFEQIRGELALRNKNIKDN